MIRMKPDCLFRVMIVCGASAALTFAVGCRNGNDVAVDDDDVVLNDIEVEIPTQEELDAEAAAEITPENADEVFRELEDAIMGDDDDDDL